VEIIETFSDKATKIAIINRPSFDRSLTEGWRDAVNKTVNALGVPGQYRAYSDTYENVKSYYLNIKGNQLTNPDADEISRILEAFEAYCAKITNNFAVIDTDTEGPPHIVNTEAHQILGDLVFDGMPYEEQSEFGLQFSEQPTRGRDPQTGRYRSDPRVTGRWGDSKYPNLGTSSSKKIRSATPSNAPGEIQAEIQALFTKLNNTNATSLAERGLLIQQLNSLQEELRYYKEQEQLLTIYSKESGNYAKALDSETKFFTDPYSKTEIGTGQGRNSKLPSDGKVRIFSCKVSPFIKSVMTFTQTVNRQQWGGGFNLMELITGYSTQFKPRGQQIVNRGNIPEKALTEIHNNFMSKLFLKPKQLIYLTSEEHEKIKTGGLIPNAVAGVASDIWKAASNTPKVNLG
jgi:hypothetical protein